MASLPLVVLASAAISALLIPGGPSRASTPGAALQTDRVAAGKAAAVASGRRGHRQLAIPRPHGYWLSSAFIRRGSHDARARTPAVVVHPRLVANPPARPAKARPARPVATAATTGKPLGAFLVTCYDLAGITASGAPVGPEAVAVDPSVIPLGTHMYVQGAGPRIALDTGGAIKGRHLDIWAPSYTQCINWGAQTRSVWLRG